VRLRTALALGRVSNLPTVWSDLLAGAVLAGGRSRQGPLLVAVVGASLLYAGGMLLNDAFDRDRDARERPERPIPSGRATPRQVFAAGFALLAAGIGALALAGRFGRPELPWAAPLAGTGLAALIVLYDAWHQANPLAPFLMGLCRAALYVVAAAVVGGASGEALAGPRLWGAAAALLAYVAGLTLVASRETRARFGRALWPFVLLLAPLVLPLPGTAAGVALAALHAAWVAWCLSYLSPRRGPRIPLAVTGLIAGIALLDARLAAAAGAGGVALACAGCFALTLALQRRIQGT
jgi:4-hydroxybenzoate polyprenyltransferase